MNVTVLMRQYILKQHRELGEQEPEQLERFCVERGALEPKALEQHCQRFNRVRFFSKFDDVEFLQQEFESVFRVAIVIDRRFVERIDESCREDQQSSWLENAFEFRNRFVRRVQVFQDFGTQNDIE